MPNKNWPVGARKKIIPVGPNPDNSTPFKYKNKGIRVMAPARNNQKEIFKSLGEKKLFPSLVNK